MLTLRRRPYLLVAMLAVVLLGLHASSATLGAVGFEDRAVQTNADNDPVVTPMNAYFIVGFLAGYIVADLVDDLFGKGFAPVPTDDVREEVFDF